MPVIGEFAGIRNMMIATAHYRNGILLAPLTAQLIAGRIVNGAQAGELTIFGPERFRFAVAQ
jgi:glycine/D-amino acid oxidase-like deaminating enzyme